MTRPVHRASRRVALLTCGTGELAIELALASPDDTVAGFDPDPAAIAQARRAAGIAGVADRVTFEVAATLLGHGYDLIIAPVNAAAWADRRGNRSLRV